MMTSKHERSISFRSRLYSSTSGCNHHILF
nr:MAG TPA: hypothetical protein [Caudoviricetes sp.]